MENRRSNYSQGLASVRASVSDRRISAEGQRRPSLIGHPLRVNVDQLKSVYQVGETLDCLCRIDVLQSRVKVVETSVLWTTDGKGDLNIGVHYFDRRSHDPSQPIDPEESPMTQREWARREWSEPYVDRPEESLRFSVSTLLPASPLSYRGQIIRINWQVKLRVFMVNDAEFEYLFPFRLVARS